jgi:hypothetical protein
MHHLWLASNDALLGSSQAVIILPFKLSTPPPEKNHTQSKLQFGESANLIFC